MDIFEKANRNEIHAVFFIRNSVKNELVMFLVFIEIYYGFCFLVKQKNDSLCFLKIDNFKVVVSYFLGTLREAKVVNVNFCTYIVKFPLKSPLSVLILLNCTILIVFVS